MIEHVKQNPMKLSLPTLQYQVGYGFRVAADYAIGTGITGVDTKVFNGEGAVIIRLTSDGWLWISKDYTCDGASGPTRDDSTSAIGALIHDVYYQLCRLGQFPRSRKERKMIDIEFWVLLRAAGMPRWRARLWYWGVRLGGRKSTLPSRRRVTKFAP